MSDEQLLQCLGITQNYKGHHVILAALILVRRDPSHLLGITKSLYPTLAKQFGTSGHAIERNMRTAVTVAWKRAPSALQQMARFPLDTRPSVGQFLSILASSRELSD